MASELIYTSTPKGLVPGSYGFCVVARSRAMNERVAVVLKELSGYGRISGALPVAYSHFMFDDGGRGVRVLARVADAGLDYTKRTNQIAHFVALEKQDLVPCGPAELLAADPPLFKARWDAPPQWFETPTAIPSLPEPRFHDSEWERLTGDLGWAGALAATVRTGQSVALIARPEHNVLRLFQEALSLVEPDQRWKATFSTYYTKSLRNVRVQWKTAMVGTPEEMAFRAMETFLTIDLTNPEHLGEPDGFLATHDCVNSVAYARRVLLRAPAPAAPPRRVPNLAPAGAAQPARGAAYLGDRQSGGVYGLAQPASPLPDARAQAQPAAPGVPGKQRKVLNYGRELPIQGAPVVTPRREKRDGGVKVLVWTLIGMILTLAVLLAVALVNPKAVDGVKNFIKRPQEIKEAAQPDAGKVAEKTTEKKAAKGAEKSAEKVAEKRDANVGEKPRPKTDGEEDPKQEEFASNVETQEPKQDDVAPDDVKNEAEEAPAETETEEVNASEAEENVPGEGAEPGGAFKDASDKDEASVNRNEDGSESTEEKATESDKADEKEVNGGKPQSEGLGEGDDKETPENQGGKLKESDDDVEKLSNDFEDKEKRTPYLENHKWGFKVYDESQRSYKVVFPKFTGQLTSAQGNKALIYDISFKVDEKIYTLGNKDEIIKNKHFMVFMLTTKPNRGDSAEPKLQDETFAILAILQADEKSVVDTVLLCVTKKELKSFLDEFRKDFKKIEDIRKKLDEKGIEHEQREATFIDYGDKNVELGSDKKFVVWKKEDKLELVRRITKKVDLYRLPVLSGWGAL